MTTQSGIITELNNHISDECKRIDLEERFDEMLDEIYSFDAVGGPFASMSPSRVLKEVDPIAYRCGVNDYENSEEWVEIDGDYYNRRDAEKAKEEFIEGRESVIFDLEKEIEEMESDEEHSLIELASLNSKLVDLQAELKELNAHSF